MSLDYLSIQYGTFVIILKVIRFIVYTHRVSKVDEIDSIFHPIGCKRHSLIFITYYENARKFEYLMTHLLT